MEISAETPTVVNKLLLSVRGWVLSLAACATPLVIYPGGWDVWREPKWNMCLALLIVYIALHALDGDSHGIARGSGACRWAILIALWAILSTGWSSCKLHTAVIAGGILVVVISGLLAVEDFRSATIRSRVIGGMLIGGGVSMGMTWLQFFNCDPMIRWFGFEQREDLSYLGRTIYAHGFSGQPSIQGPFMALLAPIALIPAVRSKRLIVRIGFALLAGLFAATAVGTQTRAAILALVVAIPTAGLIQFSGQWKKAWKPVTIALVVILIGVTVYIAVNPYFLTKTMESVRIRGGSVGARLFYWRVSLDMLKAKPVLGFGAGRFHYHFFDYQADLLARKGTSLQPDYKLMVGQAHNDYMQTAVELGSAGLFLGLVFVFALLKTAYVASKRSSGAERAEIVLVGAAALIFCIDAAFSFPLHVAHIALYFMLVAAMIAAAGEKNRRGRNSG